MQSVGTQLAVGVFALAAWFCLYLLIATALRMWTRTSQLSHAHRAHITESFVSGVQGVACAIVGLMTVIACRHDVMGEKFPLVVYYSSVGTAYFIYDLWAMYKSHIAKISAVSGVITCMVSYLKKDFLMIVHHLTITFLLFPAVIYHAPMGDFFTGCFFCLELSTPFVNARVILSRLGYKNSKIYVVNGLLMMTVFAMCRIALFPIMYAAYLSQQTSAPSHIHALASIPMTCHVWCLLVLAPQLYWLGLMVKGAMVVMKTESSAEDKDD
ncbi:TLC domain-containing protein 3A-like [Homarus americanus]|uniref:TLC domain-containing protein 3A-like n=1 Tax=Homarus americanus TaxID=6706 RepID=A0A8J5JHY8_HOMAM|nr:TLC domain-containing protein 3A-like [Homarus americanus]KAG7157920.1 TLC domain-containing protein 3A-like [Homarus americanus]